MAANSNTYHSSNVNAPRVHRALPVAPANQDGRDNFGLDGIHNASYFSQPMATNQVPSGQFLGAANLPYHHEGDRTTRGNAFYNNPYREWEAVPGWGGPAPMTTGDFGMMNVSEPIAAHLESGVTQPGQAMLYGERLVTSNTHTAPAPAPAAPRVTVVNVSVVVTATTPGHDGASANVFEIQLGGGGASEEHDRALSVILTEISRVMSTGTANVA